MRHATALAALLTVLLLAGCLKSKEGFVLNKDGSGSIESTYEVDMTKARELFSAASMLMGQGSPEDIAKIPDEELANFEHPNWYRDGALAKTETDAIYTRVLHTDASLQLGRSQSCPGRAPGALDDFRLYDRSLAAPEIAALFALGS